LNLKKLNPGNIELEVLKDRGFNGLPKFVLLVAIPGNLLVITHEYNHQTG